LQRFDGRFRQGAFVRHVVKRTSNVIPLRPVRGAFVIDVCLKTNVRHRREAPASPVGKPFSAAIFEKRLRPAGGKTATRLRPEGAQSGGIRQNRAAAG
jgi:hypothetical protein